MGSNVVELRNVSKIYNEGKSNECIALSNVNLAIESGELLAVLGRSGSGKTTMLNIIGCLDTPDSGEYMLNGIEVSNLSDKALSKMRAEYIGYVLQEYALIPEQNVFNNVILPLYFSTDRTQRNDKSKIMHILKKVGIDDIAFKQVELLSGGQKQRTAIARALVNNPAIILADEPTGALDSETSRVIIDILMQLNKEGCTIVIVTHDEKIAAHCGRIIHLADGKIL
jgi:putative ABC transport system ATP-binding protein